MNRPRMCVVVALCGLLLGALWAAEAPRKWTSTQGTSIQAALVATNADKVVLQKATGSPIQVPRASLSKTDQAYIDEWAKRNVPPPPPPSAAPLAFKSFRLNMTREAVTNVMRAQNWEYEITTNPEKDQVYLKATYVADGNASRVASAGNNPLTWSRLGLTFHTNVVREIDVHGPDIPTEALEQDIMKWLEPADQILTAEHGKSDTTLDRVQLKFQVISGLRKMGNYQIEKWKKSEDQEIILRAVRVKREDLYCGQIVYRLIDHKKTTSGGKGKADVGPNPLDDI